MRKPILHCVNPSGSMVIIKYDDQSYQLCKIGSPQWKRDWLASRSDGKYLKIVVDQLRQWGKVPEQELSD